MADPRDKKIGYKMNQGSKEKDTLTSFSEAQYKMLKDKFIMSSTGFAGISGVTGKRVDVKKSFSIFDKVYGEDTGAKLKAVQDLYGGLSKRSKGEVKGGLGPYANLFN
jgi:hypothetical protein